MKNAAKYKAGKILLSYLLLALFAGYACTDNKTSKHKAEQVPGRGWKTQFTEQLPLLGHRNWILIVDKAFPAQNSEGIKTIYTQEKLLPVLTQILKQIDESSHVKPLVFTDKELDFLTNGNVPGIMTYRDELQGLLKGYPVKTLLHDSVFSKIDEAAKLFDILVLKTEATMPYSSVFIQLDCKYWDAEKENIMRTKMDP